MQLNKRDQEETLLEVRMSEYILPEWEPRRELYGKMSENYEVFAGCSVGCDYCEPVAYGSPQLEVLEELILARGSARP